MPHVDQLHRMTTPQYLLRRIDDGNEGAILQSQLRIAREQLSKVASDLRGQNPYDPSTSPSVSMIRYQRLERTVKALEGKLSEVSGRNPALEFSNPGSVQPGNPISGFDPLSKFAWNGRAVYVIPDPSNATKNNQITKLASMLSARATNIEKRLTTLELSIKRGNGQASSTNHVIESTWDKETKKNVAQGSRVGDLRAKKKAEAKKKLQQKKIQFQKQILTQNAQRVQAVFRGHLGRKKMRVVRENHRRKLQHEKATLIQSHFRGQVSRRKIERLRSEMNFNQQSAAASVIQNQIRGKLARENFRNTKSKQTRRKAAAQIIQAWYRGCVARYMVLHVREEFRADLEEAAAILVQSVFRMRLATKRVDQIREDMYDALEEAAAIMLQAAWRGYKARLELKSLRRQKAEVEDKLLEQEWADRVKKQYVAKFFLGMKERAAMRIQSLVRGFIERRIAKRRLQRKRSQQVEADRQKELHQNENIRKLDEKQKQNTAAQKQLLVSTVKELNQDGRVVYSGHMTMPIRHSRAESRLSSKEGGVPVEVTVQEVSKPQYQLRFGIFDRSAGVVFKKQLDIDTLERLLKPLFINRGLTSTINSTAVERAMFNWVATGKPPRRKHVITWILDRMWFDESAVGGRVRNPEDRELCLGSKSAKFLGTLHRTLTPALTEFGPNDDVHQDEFSADRFEQLSVLSRRTPSKISARIPDENIDANRMHDDLLSEFDDDDQSMFSAREPASGRFGSAKTQRTQRRRTFSAESVETARSRPRDVLSPTMSHSNNNLSQSPEVRRNLFRVQQASDVYHR